MNQDIRLMMDLHSRVNSLHGVLSYAPWASRTREYIQDQLALLEATNDSINHPVWRGVAEDLSHASDMLAERNIVALQGALERISEGLQRAIESYVEVLERYYPETATIATPY